MRRITLLLFLVISGCAKPVATVNAPPPVPEAGAMVNQFAFDFYAELRKTETDKNIFISPYSISTALGMTATGARGNTFEQMKKVLHLPDDATADAYFANLAAALKSGNGYELSTANAVWAQSGMPWEEPFRKRLASYGVNTFWEVDFRTNPEAARKQVNAWAEAQTKEKIKELLKWGTVDGDTRMVLANAIYFKGQWATKFDPKRTKAGPFMNADGTKSSVRFMTHNKLTAEMTVNDEASILAVPYIGNELQMVLVLPKKEDGLKALESKLNEVTWNQWMKALLKAEELTVQLPKFKLETEYKLNETLKNQGMPDAFDRNLADFSGMTKPAVPAVLFISHVAHKTFVEVNEDGTEAAAATAVVMADNGAEIAEYFNFNRPFLFAIRHRGTGAILFLGRVEKL